MEDRMVSHLTTSEVSTTSVCARRTSILISNEDSEGAKEDAHRKDLVMHHYLISQSTPQTASANTKAPQDSNMRPSHLGGQGGAGLDCKCIAALCLVAKGNTRLIKRGNGGTVVTCLPAAFKRGRTSWALLLAIRSWGVQETTCGR